MFRLRDRSARRSTFCGHGSSSVDQSSRAVTTSGSLRPFANATSASRPPSPRRRSRAGPGRAARASPSCCFSACGNAGEFATAWINRSRSPAMSPRSSARFGAFDGSFAAASDRRSARRRPSSASSRPRRGPRRACAAFRIRSTFCFSVDRDIERLCDELRHRSRLNPTRAEQLAERDQPEELRRDRLRRTSPTSKEPRASSLFSTSPPIGPVRRESPLMFRLGVTSPPERSPCPRSSAPVPPTRWAAPPGTPCGVAAKAFAA